VARVIELEKSQAPWHLRLFYGVMRKMFGKDLTPAKIQMRLRVVPLRYMVAFRAGKVLAAKDFLAKKNHSQREVERVQISWTKPVLLTMALWSRPYTKTGLW